MLSLAALIVPRWLNVEACNKEERWALVKFEISPMLKSNKASVNNEWRETKRVKTKKSLESFPLSGMGVFQPGLDSVAEGDCGMLGCTWVRPITSTPAMAMYQVEVVQSYGASSSTSLCAQTLTFIKCDVVPS